MSQENKNPVLELLSLVENTLPLVNVHGHDEAVAKLAKLLRNGAYMNQPDGVRIEGILGHWVVPLPCPPLVVTDEHKKDALAIGIALNPGSEPDKWRPEYLAIISETIAKLAAQKGGDDA